MLGRRRKGRLPARSSDTVQTMSRPKFVDCKMKKSTPPQGSSAPGGGVRKRMNGRKMYAYLRVEEKRVLAPRVRLAAHVEVLVLGGLRKDAVVLVAEMLKVS